MRKNEITLTQVKWIVNALQHEIGAIRDEMEHAQDGSPICAIGEVMLGGRETLVTKLTDMVASGCKTIRIIK